MLGQAEVKAIMNCCELDRTKILFYIIRAQPPVQSVSYLDEILVEYSYSIHYQPIGSHLSSTEEENNLGHILYIF